MEKQKGFVLTRGMLIIITILMLGGLIWLFTQGPRNQTAQNNNTSDSSEQTEQLTPEQLAAKADVQVKDDLARIASAVNSYVNNNSGTYPSDETETSEVLTNYILEKPFLSPITHNSYTLTLAAGREQGVVNLLRGTCNADKNNTVPTQNARTYAVLTQLSDKSVYCIDV